MNTEIRNSRTACLLGESTEKLKNASVAVFGLGGVGSYTAEALVRAGVGRILIIDKDSVEESNINRQLIATYETLGMRKCEAALKRLKSINPEALIETYDIFYDAKTKETVPLDSIDYIADAIDTVTSKLLIIEEAKRLSVPVISCMGTGNKLDPSRFRISDIKDTSVCPLARVIRRELKTRGISSLTVLWSDESPITPDISFYTGDNTQSKKRQIPGSISYVPSVAGLMIAGKIIRDISGV